MRKNRKFEVIYIITDLNNNIISVFINPDIFAKFVNEHDSNYWDKRSLFRIKKSDLEDILGDKYGLFVLWDAR